MTVTKQYFFLDGRLRTSFTLSNQDGEQEDISALFAVGDKVMHRASGRKAIITRVCTRCTNPEHTMGIHCLNWDECHREPMDAYDISPDFGEELEGVRGFLLTTTL